MLPHRRAPYRANGHHCKRTDAGGPSTRVYTGVPAASGPLTVTQITTHILDTANGRPAADVLVTLQQRRGDDWLMLGSVETDADGRVADFTGGDDVLPAGIYRLSFYVGDYHERIGTPGFWPQIDIAFDIAGDGQHYHVPLLLNPFGYSTYRGS